MATEDIFDQKRLDRCIAIHQAICKNWQETRYLDYTIRATERLTGLSHEELQKQKFAVGVGENLEVIPFFDLLMVLSMIEQTGKALDSKQGVLNMNYPRSFTDAEAARLILGFKIEAPHG